MDTDISDFKKIKYERGRLAESLSLAMEAAEIGHWEIEPENGPIICSDRTLQIFGLEGGTNNRPKTDFTNMIHPRDRDVTVKYFATSMRELKDIACDYRIIATDGQEKYIRSRGKYMPNFEGGGRYIGVAFDLTDDYAKTVAMEKTCDQLKHESRHDALTSLANRRGLDEVLAEHTATHKTGSITAMHFDIDHFKQINDVHGHYLGDLVLKHAATILQSVLPEDVFIARIGGDEFVAFFPHAPRLNSLKSSAKKVINMFEKPYFFNGYNIDTRISIGIASYDVQAKNKQNIFVAADEALYHAKNNGRGTFSIYDDNMENQKAKREKIQTDLTHAFEHGEVICHYQPLFDTQTMEVSSLEALVRWDNPKHGLVMPDQFLSIAEYMGVIGKLDEIVLRRVLHDLADWTEEGISVPRISVNISAQRLTDPNLAMQLTNMSIPPGMIVFELLESNFFDVMNKVANANLCAIKALGIDIEIDDFGTGGASIISLLRVFPKRLKIDRELVQPIVHCRERRALLKEIIKIGKILNIEVVAEGVETVEHIDILREFKCDYLQGFGLARPMSSTAIRELLISHEK